MRVCMATCSMRSLKTRTQRLSQRTQTWRPINSGGVFVKGFFYFDVTIPMHTAPRFLEARKKSRWQRLQMCSLLFKTGSDLLARRTVDALVCNAALQTL